MTEIDNKLGWLSQKEVEDERKESTPSSGTSRTTDLLNSIFTSHEEPSIGSTQIWMNPELLSHEATANLDEQDPATLYYLGRVAEKPEVCEIFVESLDRGRIKHWTVLSERNYEVMDEIYDIEEDTLNRFPLADLAFRITIRTERGPSVAPSSTKIFEND